jgi:hypothetical protein
LINECVYAELVQEGAYVSKVRYLYGGTLYEIMVENDEFIYDDDNLDEEIDF